MNKQDIKIGQRYKFHVGWYSGEKYHGVCVKQTKAYNNWNHTFRLDDGKTPDTVKYSHYKNAFVPSVNEEGNPTFDVTVASGNVTCKVDDKNAPMLTAAQLRQRQANVRKVLKEEDLKALRAKLVGQFQLVGIEAWEDAVQRKYGQHKVPVVCIPMKDCESIIKLLQPMVKAYMDDLNSMIDDIAVDTMGV